MTVRSRRRLGLALVALLLLPVAACSAAGEPPAPVDTTGAGASATAVVNVRLTEWGVKPAVASVHAGLVTFDATDRGAIAHELVVVKTDTPENRLPQTNGTVDEQQVPVIGRTPSVKAGKSATVTVTLTSGNYVLLCNLPAHYGEGMHVAFTVE